MPDSPQRIGYVGLHVESDRVTLVRTRRRRWWQLWKPKRWTEVLAEAAHTVRGDATVKLMAAGNGYIGLINDNVVLRWPPHPSVLGGTTTTTGFFIRPLAASGVLVNGEPWDLDDDASDDFWDLASPTYDSDADKS